MRHLGAMRILTTHVGSLPRPDDLVALLRQHDAAGSAAEALAARALSAVDDAVRAQVAAGLDIVNDGEQGRTDYSTYIKDRLTGFEGEHADQVMGADLKEFPEFAARRRGSVFRRPTCTGLIASADCGFATFADTPTVDPKIAWAKLGAMVEGARLASRALWKRSQRVNRSAATGARARAGRRPSRASRASR